MQAQPTPAPGDQSGIDRIYKALRLVPEFDGNSNVLTRFIKLCDQLVESFLSERNQLNTVVLINGILNKVTGQAARLINSNGIPENWDGIRKALINNFADQRDETSLYNDLALLSQGSSSPQEFYEKCQNLFSTIMTYITLHETISSTIDSKRALYQKLTLQAFVRGLKDPLGSRIRCMRPETIEKALEYVHEEMNTLYLQQRNYLMPDKKQFNMPSNPFKLLAGPAQQGYNPSLQSKPNAFNMPGPSRDNFLTSPHRPPAMWRPQNNLVTPFRGPTRTQQMFAAPPPNYNPQSNIFRFPPRNPNMTFNRPPTNFNSNNAPKPMSGVSHFVPKQLPPSGHDWTKFGNPPPSNYFKTREMHMNDCFDYQFPDDAYSYYPYEEYEYPYYYNEPEIDPQFNNNEYYYPEFDDNRNVAPPTKEDFQKVQELEKPK